MDLNLVDTQLKTSKNQGNMIPVYNMTWHTSYYYCANDISGGGQTVWTFKISDWSVSDQI